MSPARYRVNEVFYSLQGEGLRAGTPNVFVRFSGCNLKCNRDEHGFDCDTEFVSGRWLTPRELLDEVRFASKDCRSIVFTGGEPALQLDERLVRFFHDLGYYLAIETNGTRPLPEGIDWVCVSPKTAEHTLRLSEASEVKYVRAFGQGLPKPRIDAPFYLISPAFNAEGRVDAQTMKWCVALVRERPDKWRLSVQMHKLWRVR